MQLRGEIKVVFTTLVCLFIFSGSAHAYVPAMDVNCPNFKDPGCEVPNTHYTITMVIGSHSCSMKEVRTPICPTCTPEQAKYIPSEIDTCITACIHTKCPVKQTLQNENVPIAQQPAPAFQTASLEAPRSDAAVPSLPAYDNLFLTSNLSSPVPQVPTGGAPFENPGGAAERGITSFAANPESSYEVLPSGSLTHVSENPPYQGNFSNSSPPPYAPQSLPPASNWNPVQSQFVVQTTFSEPSVQTPQQIAWNSIQFVPRI